MASPTRTPFLQPTPRIDQLGMAKAEPAPVPKQRCFAFSLIELDMSGIPHPWAHRGSDPTTTEQPLVRPNLQFWPPTRHLRSRSHPCNSWMSAAYWASCTDCLFMVRNKHPLVVDRIFDALNRMDELVSKSPRGRLSRLVPVNLEDFNTDGTRSGLQN